MQIVCVGSWAGHTPFPATLPKTKSYLYRQINTPFVSLLSYTLVCCVVFFFLFCFPFFPSSLFTVAIWLYATAVLNEEANVSWRTHLPLFYYSLLFVWSRLHFNILPFL
jgi:hypothetical protein